MTSLRTGCKRKRISLGNKMIVATPGNPGVFLCNSIKARSSHEIQVDIISKLTKNKAMKKQIVAAAAIAAIMSLGAAVPALAKTTKAFVRAGTSVEAVTSSVVTNRTLSGTVMSVASTSLTVKRANGQVWTVNIASSTPVTNRLWQRIPLSQVQVGNSVRAAGAADTATLTFTPSFLHDLSIPGAVEDKITLQGTVTSVASSTNSFMLKLENGQVWTVNVASTTRLVNKVWQPIAFSNIAVGNTVRVFGTGNTSTLVFDPAIVRDVSLAAAGGVNQQNFTFSGTITSKFQDSFNVRGTNGISYHVIALSSTSIMTGSGSTTPFSSLKTGNTVDVSGTLNLSSLIIRAASIKDLSI